MPTTEKKEYLQKGFFTDVRRLGLNGAEKVYQIERSLRNLGDRNAADLSLDPVSACDEQAEHEQRGVDLSRNVATLLIDHAALVHKVDESLGYVVVVLAAHKQCAIIGISR